MGVDFIFVWYQEQAIAPEGAVLEFWNFLRFEFKDKGMIFTLIALVSFFDREDIYGVVSTLFETGGNSAAVRLWLKLNQNTQIRLKPVLV